MTAKELIEALQKLPPDLPVYYACPDFKLEIDFAEIVEPHIFDLSERHVVLSS